MEKIGNDYHTPVLYYETLDNLVINPDGIYIDCTLGGKNWSFPEKKKFSLKTVHLVVEAIQKEF